MTTTTVAYKPNGMRWLGSAPITWDRKVSKLTSQREMQELARWLDSVCERAARLSGYLDGRGALGCGDAGHAEGVKRSNRKATKVRRALDYTYPKQDMRF